MNFSVSGYHYANKCYTYDEMIKFSEARLNSVNDGMNKKIQTILSMVKGINVLDVGCRIGTICKYLANQGHNVTGTDPRDSDVEIARIFSYDKNIYYKTFDSLKQYPPQIFDTIICTETLGRLNNPIESLLLFRSLLKSDGRLLISTPNSASLKNIIRSLTYSSKTKREFLNHYFSLESNGTQDDYMYHWDFITLGKFLYRSGFFIEHSSFSDGIEIKFPRIKTLRLPDKLVLDALSTLMNTIVINARPLSVNDLSGARLFSNK